LIYGPGDPHSVLPVLTNARSGKMKARIGRPNSVSEMVYVDNMAHAHILAARKLAPASPACGQAYFITDGSRRTYFDYFSMLIEAQGMQAPPPARYVPYPLIWLMAALIECVFAALGLITRVLNSVTRGRITRLPFPEAPLNFFVLFYLSNEFTLVSHKARRDLDWQPIVSPEEGLRRTLRWVQTLKLV